MQTDRLLTYVLRHKPESIDIEVDKNGWTDVTQLILKINSHPKLKERINFSKLKSLVDTDSKSRFEFKDSFTKIRACQGHTIKVDLQLKEEAPPEILYHGTIEKSLKLILKEGIKKMSRHAVHLSTDIETATEVGSRRATPLLLKIEALRMRADGYKFYKSTNGVWLTEKVPPKYIKVHYGKLKPNSSN